MAYFPFTPGQQPMSSSQGVVIASDQSPVSVTGTVIATPSGNQSVSGTVLVNNGSVVAFMGGSWSASVQGAFSVIGTVPVTQAGAWSTSVVGQVGTSMIGTVPVTQSGTNVTSLVSTVPSSVIVGASIFGQLPAGTAPLGSIAALQGTNPWVVNTSASSVIGYWDKSPSVVGTYAEDAAHATADKGLFVLGVRNDLVASVTGANLEYTAMSHDSAGRFLTKPFAAEEARIEGYNSVVSGSVTTLVAAGGAGIKNYITDIHIANTGAAATLVTFRSGGGSSVLGYTIAPAGGGSNMTFQMPMRTLANETFDFQATTSTSILFATVRGFKAP